MQKLSWFGGLGVTQGHRKMPFDRAHRVSLKADRTAAHDRTVRPLCGRAVGPR